MDCDDKTEIPDHLRTEVSKAVNRYLQGRPTPPSDDVKVKLRNPMPPEPSAVDRLSALVDDDAQQRLAEHEEQKQAAQADIDSGILRMDVSVRPQRPADYIVIDFAVDPDSKTNANEEALDE